MKRSKRNAISIHELHCFADSINAGDGTQGRIKINPLPSDTYQVVDRRTGSPLAGADDLSLSELYVWLNGYRQRQMDEAPTPKIDVKQCETRSHILRHW